MAVSSAKKKVGKRRKTRRKGKKEEAGEEEKVEGQQYFDGKKKGKQKKKEKKIWGIKEKNSLFRFCPFSSLSIEIWTLLQLQKFISLHEYFYMQYVSIRISNQKNSEEEQLNNCSSEIRKVGSILAHLWLVGWDSDSVQLQKSSTHQTSILIYDMLNSTSLVREKWKNKMEKLHQKNRKSQAFFVLFQLVEWNPSFVPIAKIGIPIEMSVLTYDASNSATQAS